MKHGAFQQLQQLTEKYCPTSKTVGNVVVFLMVLCSLVAVMLWDMNKAHQMSEIIHNDHTSRWSQMDSNTLRQWMSPLDLCMMQLDQPNVDLKVYKLNNCSKYATPVASQKLFCSIGSSLGRQCAPPLSTRSFFTARIKDPHLGDPHAKFLSNALKSIAGSGRPVVFVGDGLSKQNQDAMVCEIARTDKVSITGSMSDEYSQLQSNFTVRWRDISSLNLDILFYKLTRFSEPTKSGHKKKRTKRLRSLAESDMNTSTTVYDTSATSATISPNSTAPSVARATTLAFEEIRRSVEALAERHRGVVLVANIGVWYNSREKFRADLPLFLEWLDGLAQQSGNLVFFRETAAQHWNQSRTGYYSPQDMQATGDGSCSPVADSTPEYDWRNGDVYHGLTNGGFHSVRVIPFRDLTLPLYNMHPSPTGEAAANSTVPQDCTHYCYFPQMWQSVWYDIHSAVINPEKSKWQASRE